MILLLKILSVMAEVTTGLASFLRLELLTRGQDMESSDCHQPSHSGLHLLSQEPEAWLTRNAAWHFSG